jgi:hypothetical protein
MPVLLPSGTSLFSPIGLQSAAHSVSNLPVFPGNSLWRFYEWHRLVFARRELPVFTIKPSSSITVPE